MADAQREWNKIWRELYVKNYYKALDYQGINFKTNDKKVVAVRSLVQEAETLLAEQLERAGDLVPGKPLYQYEFNLADTDVFNDVNRSIFSYLEKTTSFSNADKERIAQFTRTFFPRFFGTAATATTAAATTTAASGAAATDTADAAGAGAGAAAADDHTAASSMGHKNTHILYGNNAIFGLVRLYQVCAHAARAPTRNEVTAPDATHLGA